MPAMRHDILEFCARDLATASNASDERHHALACSWRQVGPHHSDLSEVGIGGHGRKNCIILGVYDDCVGFCVVLWLAGLAEVSGCS
jgi:hypothetical protein